MNKGHLHPISQLIREIYSIFGEMGFEIADGPELETEFYNFDALNIPKDSPSRDMQDTFWLKQVRDTRSERVSSQTSGSTFVEPARSGSQERKLLRTHTSSVQIRHMEKNKPPFRIIVPGKVFRNEATDATHEAQFYQLEALVVDKDISLANLKGTLTTLFQKLFGPDVQIYFRPSYFPFTEPSVEVFMKWKDKWLEMGGAGMVNPKVFEHANVDPKSWRGYAFGFGIDRLVMLRYGVDDVRLLYAGDLRLVNQF